MPLSQGFCKSRGALGPLLRRNATSETLPRKLADSGLRTLLPTAHEVDSTELLRAAKTSSPGRALWPQVLGNSPLPLPCGAAGPATAVALVRRRERCCSPPKSQSTVLEAAKRADVLAPPAKNTLRPLKLQLNRVCWPTLTIFLHLSSVSLNFTKISPCT